MQITADNKWNPLRRWGTRETPPRHAALYFALNLMLLLGAFVSTSILLGEFMPGRAAFLAVKGAGIAAGAGALYILGQNLVDDWKHQTLNIFTLIYALGTCAVIILLWLDFFIR